jgi:tetratricopeptide (TPR) repeat protein
VVFDFIIKLEIILLFLSGSYILYYLWDKIYQIYERIQKLINPRFVKKVAPTEENLLEEKPETKQVLKSQVDTKTSPLVSERKKAKLNEADKKRLQEIIKKVHIHTQKSYFESAKSLIVEWLAIDKLNKDLNMELASIYEQEKNYTNAEYIYRDIVDVVKNNDEIMKRLGFVLALQKKFLESIDIYERLFHKNAGDMEVVELLTDLHNEVGNYDSAMKYVVLSLKEKPKNVDRLILKWNLLKREWKVSEAYIVFKQVLELQPYNTEARDNIKKWEETMKEKEETTK